MANQEDIEFFNRKHVVLFEELKKLIADVKTKNMFAAILIGIDKDSGEVLPSKEEVVVKSKNIGSFNFETTTLKIRINFYQVEGSPLEFSIDTLSKNYEANGSTFELKKIEEFSDKFEEYTDSDYVVKKFGDVLDRICAKMFVRIVDSGLTPHKFIPITEEDLESDKKWIAEYNRKKLSEEEQNIYSPAKPKKMDTDEVQPEISSDFTSWLDPNNLQHLQPENEDTNNQPEVSKSFSEWLKPENLKKIDQEDNKDDEDPNTLPRPKL